MTRPPAGACRLRSATAHQPPPEPSPARVYQRPVLRSVSIILFASSLIPNRKSG